MAKNAALAYLEACQGGLRGVAVLDALAGMIERAGLQMGDRLPPEVQLAAQLGVGRSTMREALNRWEGLGIIRRRRGDGTYLSARVPVSGGAVPVMVQLEGTALLHVIEVRRCLENEAVRKTALCATPAQRAEISHRFALLRDVIDRGEDYHDADRAFHDVIYDTTGNPMFRQILRRLESMMERNAESPFMLPAFGLSTFTLHRDLADGIIAGDPDRAAAAIGAVLDMVEAEVRQIMTGTSEYVASAYSAASM